MAPGLLSARTKIGALGENQLVSSPEPVTGYGAVGVTWEHGEEVPSDDLSFDVRTLTDDAWSDWIELPYDDDHAPDPDSAEGRHARPGTDVLLVGKVDQVQVRSTSSTATQPADMRLAVIAPGTPTSTARELPEIETDEDGVAPEGTTEPETTEPRSDAGTTSEDGMSLEAATYTPKPVIYSRAQWGANEKLRDKSSLHYFEIHAGFVHHTVNANGYSRSEVPGILRSIYAYHTQSRGWSDVGYNFLVDRFGRIWEGRAGGVDRPVVGAHTLGYNDYAFAMSAIGNFETARPSAALLEAYGEPDGLEAVAARHRRLLHQAGGRPGHVPGDQRPPRRRLHGLPGPVPLREDPQDPPARGGRPAGLGRPAARVRPGRQRPPRPDRPARQRRAGLHHPDRRAARLRRAPDVDRRVGRHRVDRGVARPDRRRRGSTSWCAAPTGRPWSGPVPPTGSRPASTRCRGSTAATWSPPSAT